MKRIGKWFLVNWPVILTVLLAVFLISALFLYKIDTLLPGLSNNEIAQIQKTSTPSALIENPIGLPHKTVQFIAHKSGLSPIVAIRAASTILAMIVALAFYYVLSNWYTKRIAVLGTLLFVTSSSFLNVARSGTDLINYSLLFLAFACVIWLQKSDRKAAPLIVSGLILLSLIYTPGMIWFVAPLLVWKFRWIVRILKTQKIYTLILISVITILAITPLVYGIAKDPSLVWTYLGLPNELPTPIEFIKNLSLLPLRLFAINTEGYEFWLGRLPFISWFTTVMFAIGIFAYFFKRKLDRTWSIIFIFAVGAFFISLNGPVDVSLLIPFIYLIAAGGIALMLQQWFTVFPRNPFARTISLLMMSAAIGLSIFFSLRQYFVAWPNTPETKEIYIHQID